MRSEHHGLMLKVRRGLAESLLKEAERQHAEYFFDPKLWELVTRAAEAEGVEARTLVRKLVNSGLRSRKKLR